jgi:polysaccharide export outer membrane protein
MLRRIFNSLVFATFACLFNLNWVVAQTPVSASQPIAPQTAKPQVLPAAIPTGNLSDQTYRIGPGDVLDVRVFNRPELSGERRVTEAGRIRLPFIEELQVACLSEAEISQQIIAKYKKFLRDPQVDVFVKEYKSLPVAVIGSVNQPARFQLQRRIRLLELLSYAGGPNNRAGTLIHIIHSNDYDFCQNNPGITAAPADGKSATDAPDPDGEKISILTALSSVSLRDLLSGKLEANVYIQPGDIVSLPEADQFYVTGAVNRPGAFALTTKITLTQAIGLAGGINMEGAKGRVRLVRQSPDSDKRFETIYNLTDINKRKIEDIILMPNDIIEVPNSTMRAASRNLLGVSISMLSALPFFIIR